MRLKWRTVFRKRIGDDHMINEIEIQKAVLRTVTTPRHEFQKTLGKPSDALTAHIKKYALDNPKNREDIAWHVQGLLEKALYEHGSYDNFASIVQPVFEEWNAKHEFKLSYEALEAYLLHIFKTPNLRKAYIELCEGDVESYKAFASSSDGFMDYILRAIFVSNPSNPRGVRAIALKVFTAFFKEDANKEYEKSLKRLDLLQKVAPSEDKGKPVLIMFKKAVLYGQIMRELEQPFIKGFDLIFKQVIELDPRVLKDRRFGNFFKKYATPEVGEVAAVQVQEEKNEIDDFDLFTANPPVFDDVEEILLLEDNAPIASSPSESVQQEIIFGDEETAYLMSIDETIARLQNQKAEVTTIFKNRAEVPTQTTDIASYEERLKIAGEEIHRLQRSVEEEREKAKTVEESSYKSLVDAIAGARSNFLLSDLYRESLGESNHSREIVQGQLLNLFNQLNMAIGLEVYANGRAIGEEFDVARHELAHDYSVLNEVQTKGDQIRVKLLQFGWTLNGKVIVQPLIQELEGAH